MLDCPFWDDVHEKLRDAIVKENAASQWQQLSKRAVEWGLSKDEQAVVKRRVKAFTRGYPYEDFAKELRSTLERTEARTTQFLPLEVGMRDEPFFWSEVSVATVIRNLAHKAALSVQEWLERTSYVGPIRSAWERVYLFSGNQPSEVGKKGEMVPDLLYSEPAALMNTRKWLRSFSTGYDLKVVRTAAKGMEGVFALRFQDEASGTNVSPADVGFGLSQLLPVIVQGALGRRRTLLIEQPEIHLHPRLQAGLGDFFADCISAPSSNQVIVESHSEHLLLRIQHLVSDGVLSPEQVAVLFIERNPEGARVREVRMDRDGDFIDWWPDDFFEEEFRQSFRGR